ncbi:MAG TPA: hypothetical protein VLK33_00270, partial [Terriglobales bacterium]|nr:hypothetical protein [Terriglobales bacterium]
MRNITAKIALLLSVVVLCASASYAQFARNMTLKVDVPFEFNIGLKAFPAGQYYVTTVAPYTLALHDHNNNTLDYFVAGSTQSLELQ